MADISDPPSALVKISSDKLNECVGAKSNSSYKDLKVWQKGIDLVKLTYELTKLLPQEEEYGLKGQLRRSAVSIPSNIAEGYGRGTTKSYLNFLRISRGSLVELETQIIICKELDLIDNESTVNILSLILEENKMLNALIRSIDN